MPVSSAEPRPQTDRSELAFSRKIQTGFWLVGAILVIIGFAGYQSIREFDETVDWVAHSQEVLRRLQVVLSDIQDIEIGLRGYVMTGKERFLDPYKNRLILLRGDTEALSTAILANPQDPPEQSRNLEKLTALIDKKLGQLKTMLALRKDASYQSAQMESHMAESKELMDSIRVLLDDMQTVERDRLIARDRHADKTGENAIHYFVIGVMLEIMILIWIAWQIRREISQRQQAQDALSRTQGELELRIRERTKALVGSNERLRELSHRLMNVQETERRQIAHDLHDEIGQSLTAMKLGLREANKVLEAGPTGALLKESLTILDQVIRQVRNLALDLRPSLLDELGLVPALKWYIKRQGERAGWETEYTPVVMDNHIPADVKITCFRIVQEALTNVARYAEATHVQVCLKRQNDHLVLVIEDNGKGFNVEQAKNRARSGFSIGLLGMEERARLVGGELTITSSPKSGTRLSASLPLVKFTPQLVASEEMRS
jgi:signal transduction histidine kinase